MGVARIEGTAFGFDKDTQYNTIVDKGLGQIWFYREVQWSYLNQDSHVCTSNVLEPLTDEKEFTQLRVGDGSSINITITQTN